MKKQIKDKGTDESGMALPLRNLYWILGGLALMVLGYVLMVGGGPQGHDDFREAALFSFRRMTLAPILVVLGFAAEVVAILRVGKRQ